MDEDKRRFLKHSIKVGATLVGVGGLGGVLWLREGCAASQKPSKIKDFSVADFKGEADIAIVKGADHYAATRKAIELFGGISHFVKSGDTVLLKPNAAWNRPRELAATTNPDVLRAVIDLVKKQNPKRVIVTDNTCNDARRSFRNSGLEEACKKSGADIVWLDEDTDYVPLAGSATFLDSWQFLKLFQQVDKVINIPVVKSHSLSGTTVALKNWFGVLTGKRSLLHQNIHQTVAFIGKVVKPTLVVADATRVMMRNGPAGGTLDDVKIYNEVIVSTDQVLVDTYGSKLVIKDKLPEFIIVADRIGVGTKNLDHAKKKTLAL